MQTQKSASADELFSAILSLRTPEECYRFFEDVCTIKELQVISQRLAVARKLDEGNVYAQVAEETGASTATISRVNRCLLYGSGGYRLVIDRIKEAQT